MSIVGSILKGTLFRLEQIFAQWQPFVVTQTTALFGMDDLENGDSSRFFKPNVGVLTAVHQLVFSKLATKLSFNCVFSSSRVVKRPT